MTELPQSFKFSNIKLGDKNNTILDGKDCKKIFILRLEGKAREQYGLRLQERHLERFFPILTECLLKGAQPKL